VQASNCHADDLPEWLRTPLIPAGIAAIGYVAKLAIEGLSKWQAGRRERLAKLIALQSLLLGSKSVFEVQNKLVKRLCEEVQPGHQATNATYDRILGDGYANMNKRQKLTHGLIRSYTSKCSKTMDWLAGSKAAGAEEKLSRALQR
jgi:hypothetical protein